MHALIRKSSKVAELSRATQVLRNLNLGVMEYVYILDIVLSCTCRGVERVGELCF